MHVSYNGILVLQKTMACLGFGYTPPNGAAYLRICVSLGVCFVAYLQARGATGASVKERDVLYSELHGLGATFRAKHEKLQEHVSAAVAC